MDERAAGMRVVVGADGPYMVSGGPPLLKAVIVTNDVGESVAWREKERFADRKAYWLCRCGRSGAKPFCDGMHAEIGFDGTETAGHDSFLEQSVPITGPGLVLHDARRLCAEARYCDRAGGLWNLVEHCDDPAVRALAIEEAELCPSGRYVACEEDGRPIEPDLEASIALVEDPQLGVSGPVWVRGGIAVESEESGPYEVRNRVTLCRCGESKNKPFCDGSHIAAHFSDEE